MKKSTIMKILCVFSAMVWGMQMNAQNENYMAIAGDFNGWNTGGNQMTYSSEKGLWETTITLEARSYGFKFVNADSWDGDNWGGAIGMSGTALINQSDNINISIPTTGDYLFTFNDITYVYTVSLASESPEPFLNKVFLRGSLNSWGIAEMQPTEGSTVWTLEYEIETTGEYEFKILVNKEGEFGDGLEISYNNVQPKNDFQQGDGTNIKYHFEADIYIFTFNTADNNLTIRPKNENIDPKPEPTGVTFNVTVPNGTVYCYIRGEIFGNWSQLQPMLRTGNNTYTLTVNVPAGEYRYYAGFNDNGAWANGANNRLEAGQTIKNDEVNSWDAPVKADLPMIAADGSLTTTYYEATYYTLGELSDVKKLTIVGTSNSSVIDRLTNTLTNNDKITSITFNGLTTGVIEGDSEFTNLNDNCLIYVGVNTAPANWKNTIDSNGKALTNIALIDGKPFHCPTEIDMDGKEINYTRNCYTDGGWETIILPFDVINKTTPNGGLFKELININGTTLTFDDASTIVANTPYIMSFPGAGGQSKYTFTGSGIVPATPATLGATLVGTYEPSMVTIGDYILAEEGNEFRKAGENVSISSFRSFIPANEIIVNENNAAPTRLNIRFEGNTPTNITNKRIIENIYCIDGIVYLNGKTSATVYSLDGRIITSVSNKETIEGLNKGMYIINEQLIAVK